MSRSDLYLHENSPVLKNLKGITDFAELERCEGVEIAKKSLGLVSLVKDDRFDFNRLQKMHAHLFGGLYPFAGKDRSGKVEKKFDNAEHFLPTDRIKEVVNDVQSRLMENKWFDDRDPKTIKGFHKTFSSVMAKTYAEILRARPFEEKNEMAALAFIDQMAVEADYKLDWSNIDRVKGKFHQLSSQAIKGDLGGLMTAFSNMGYPVDPVVNKALRGSAPEARVDPKAGNQSLMGTIDKFMAAEEKAMFNNTTDYLSERHIEVKGRAPKPSNDNSFG